MTEAEEEDCPREDICADELITEELVADELCSMMGVIETLLLDGVCATDDCA